MENIRYLYTMEKIFEEIRAERKSQVEKFGIQTWSCLDKTLLNREGGCTPQRMCEEYEIPSQERAKAKVDLLAKRGDLTYADIALEEFCEVVSEFDPQKRRIELIQLATVCIAWVEKIEEENGK